MNRYSDHTGNGKSVRGGYVVFPFIRFLEMMLGLSAIIMFDAAGRPYEVLRKLDGCCFRTTVQSGHVFTTVPIAALSLAPF